jgi:enoyl-[acyl-carrier protein] reductase II
METSAQGLAATDAVFNLVRQRTDAPLGLQMFLRVLKQQERVDEVLDWILDGRTPLVATCVGDPAPISNRAHEAGVKHYHQVGSLKEAQRAADGGADGLIVEGAESGGLSSRRSPHLMTLLQQVRAAVDVPIVAAGGIVDGRGMAAAFALGAEGVLMGTRFTSAAESPAHQAWKQAIADTDTTLNIARPTRRSRCGLCAPRSPRPCSAAMFRSTGTRTPGREAFENGRTDLAMVGAGESATLVQEIKPVAEIIEDTVAGFWGEIQRLAGLLQPAAK